MAKATFIKSLPSFKGDARLYALDPPIKDYEGGSHPYVIVSAVVAEFTGAETYIFPASGDGKVIDWGELPGSIRGSLSHLEALKEAGYEDVQ